ncbi:MAG: tRNA preQ1(34) S-adenosylmethionine ribosyltransferase-isomerase QueA [Acaryochloridaceae cyanobacterium SU_2_1]|nr:tRNA preQ1(34) S-adenosylmethionine ribosyltransferase-isomerase QueA [Acaryochloridaceae cyanobacterium SU_2_1]
MSLGWDGQLSAYTYDLPEELIAQTPAVPRDSSRLLVVDSTGHQHHSCRDLPNLLQPGDLLVFNNTRVMPARLWGWKTGQEGAGPRVKVEVLLLTPQQPLTWLALVKPGRRLKPGAVIEFGRQDHPCLRARVQGTDPATRGRILNFEVLTDDSFEEVLDQWGQLPLPPYIQRSTAAPEQYQTIYADCLGAVAAPTAGLHFTTELLSALQSQGIGQAWLTLHVGLGTFRPVQTEAIETHEMHAEWVDLPEATVRAIERTHAQGGRVIAVGTTVTRALEGVCQSGPLRPFQGQINLFIYPGYSWQVVDGLMTNFHLPRSSLLMLVSALIGRQRLLALYEVAIANHYRFYSFGDAMLILPEATLARQP